jgi:3-dehydroquinate dehydratase-1
MKVKILPKRPTICASIIAHTVEEFLEVVRRVEGADIIEIRADGLKIESHDVGRGYKSGIKRLLRNARVQTKLPIILTVRAEKEGGVFIGTEAERVKCILEAIKLADAVDIELRMERDDRDEIIQEAKRRNKPVIVSYHDLNSTPGEDAMRGILEEECEVGASVAKLGVKANSRRDVLRLLHVTQEMSSLDVPICTISMGELGKISRVAAPFFGSAITYGYVTKETAPGQVSIAELKKAFEILGLRP